MKWMILTTAMLLFVLNNVSAQSVHDIVTDNIITVGTSYKKLDDRFILSSAATGNVFNIGYKYLKVGPVTKTALSLNADFGSLSNRDAMVKAQQFSVYFSQGFSLWRSDNEKFNSYTGYSIGTTPSFLKAISKEDTRNSWSTVNDLSLYQSFVYTTGHTRLTWDINLPLVGLSSRPGEKSNDHNTANGLVYDSYSNLFFTSWKDRRAISSSFDIKTVIDDNVSLVVGARFVYDKMEKYNLYRDVQGGLYGGISFSIK